MNDTTSETLLGAVNAVVDEHGWPGATAELIATAAGVNRTTLYRHGYTTERLLAEAAGALAASFRSAALAPLAGPGSAHDRMIALLGVLYDLADDHLGLVAGLYDGPTAVFHLGLDASAGSLVTRFEYTDPFERLLVDGNADGTLLSERPKRDAEVIFNMAGWSYVHFRRSHRWSARVARRAVSDTTLAAFLPGSSR